MLMLSHHMAESDLRCAMERVELLGNDARPIRSFDARMVDTAATVADKLPSIDFKRVTFEGRSEIRFHRQLVKRRSQSDSAADRSSENQKEEIKRKE